MATQQEIAEHLDLSPRWVRNLTKGGQIPAPVGSGGYNLDACRKAYISYLRGRCTGKVKSVDEDQPPGTDGGKLDYAVELEREKWREKKRENDLAEKMAIPYEVVVDVLQMASKQAASVFDALPLNIKRTVPSLSAKNIEDIRLEIAKARNAFANCKINGPAE